MSTTFEQWVVDESFNRTAASGLGAALLAFGTPHQRMPENSNQITMSPHGTSRTSIPVIPAEATPELARRSDGEVPAPQARTLSANRKLLKELIEEHEARKSKAYLDSRGKWTIGIGFNLDDPANMSILRRMGIDRKSLVSRKRRLSNAEIDALFEVSLDRAIMDAHAFMPTMDALPLPVQVVLVDMSFNLGLSKLSGFQDFQKALARHDFSTAADEMVDSKWYGQTGRRARRLVGIMRNAGTTSLLASTRQP